MKSVSQRLGLLFWCLPLLGIGLPGWMLLTHVRTWFFAFHSDALDAVYLLVQIGFVYAGLIAFAIVGARLTRLHGLGFARFELWKVLWLIPVGLLLLIGGDWLWQTLLQRFALEPSNRTSLVTSYAHMPWSQNVMILLICLIAPIAEELCFRGFLSRWLQQIFARWAPAELAVILALVGSAFLFALAHLDPASFGDYLVVGIVCAWLLWYTGSLWPGIVLHMLNNTLFVLVVLNIH